MCLLWDFISSFNSLHIAKSGPYWDLLILTVVSYSPRLTYHDWPVWFPVDGLLNGVQVSANLQCCLSIFFFLIVLALLGLVVAHEEFVTVHRLLSSCGLWVPECTGSVVEVLELGCPAACGILVPWPRIEPSSPALEGRFLTTGPPGKSLGILISGSWLCMQEFLCSVYPEMESLGFWIYEYSIVRDDSKVLCEVVSLITLPLATCTIHILSSTWYDSI